MHAADGWYIGPIKDHSRCYKFYVPETRGFLITQTAKTFPRHCPPPMLTRNAQILLAAKSLTEALLKKNHTKHITSPKHHSFARISKKFPTKCNSK